MTIGQQALPLHPTMRDPRTGERLRAFYRTRRGQLVWPIMGAADDPPAIPPADPPPIPPVDTPKPAGDDEPLGEAGKKALAAERARATSAEKELARYRKAEQDKADAEKSELQKAVEARETAEKKAAEADLRALRLEVAQDKGLTATQAKRLVGSTREELETDADELLSAFPAPAKDADPKPRGPKPDPSQGPKGEPKVRPTSLGAAVKQALSKS